MGILRALLWTAACVALGVFVSTYEVNGKTPLDHMQTAWKSSSLKDDVGGAMSGAKDKLAEAKQSAKEKLAVAAAPKEHISADDRNALNVLIQKKAK